MVDPANANELAGIAQEIGADVLQGALRYPSETGGWQLGDLDLSEYLDRYRDQRLVLIIAAVGEAAPEIYTCGICGFVMYQARACPRCQLMASAQADAEEDAARDILDQVADLLLDAEP